MNFIYKYWNDIDEIKEEKKIILGIISLSSGSFVSFSNTVVFGKSKINHFLVHQQQQK